MFRYIYVKLGRTIYLKLNFLKEKYVKLKLNHLQRQNLKFQLQIKINSFDRINST